MDDDQPIWMFPDAKIVCIVDRLWANDVGIHVEQPKFMQTYTILAVKRRPTTGRLHVSLKEFGPRAMWVARSWIDGKLVWAPPADINAEEHTAIHHKDGDPLNNALDNLERFYQRN